MQALCQLSYSPERFTQGFRYDDYATNQHTRVSGQWSVVSGQLPPATGYRRAGNTPRSGSGREHGRPRDPRGVTPQPLERIEIARLRLEDVDCQVAVIQEYPVPGVHTLDTER